MADLLKSACENGDFAKAVELIQQGSDPQYKGDYDRTPLHYACRSGSIELVTYLFTQCKCDVMCTDLWRETPLHKACRGGSVAVVRYLITELGCDPEQTNKNGKTSLHLACGSGSIELVKYLVTQCTCDVTCTDRGEETPLQYALRSGSVAVVRYLITKLGCDPEQTSKKGRTSLHLACGEGNLQVVQYLVREQNCNKECTDNRGWTPLHVAVQRDNLQMVQYLVEEQNCKKECTDNDGKTPLHLAVERDNLQMVQYLVGEQDCNKECTDDNGRTPLHLAVEKGNLQVVQYLVVEQNCNKECTDNDGWTPLHLAVHMENLQVVQYLVGEQNCNKECTDNGGRTPLHWAVLRDNLQMVQYLVGEQDCNKECTDDNGRTPLHLAVEKGNLQVVQYLVVEQNCNKECTDNDGWTPLHLAVHMENLQVVQYLVGEQNCNKECTDNGGRTPLHWAVLRDILQMVQYLVGEQDCNKECTDDSGRTPLHLAVEKGNLQVVQYLVVEQNCNKECTDNDGWTPLHLAVHMENLQVVQYLVGEQNCNKECTDNGGRTPLHWAVLNRLSGIVTYLLKEARCNPNSTANSGDTPLTLTYDPSIIRELLRFGADPKNDYAKCSECLPAHCPTQPAESVVKVFVVGDTGAGKTTLTKALKVKEESSGRLSRFVNRMTKVSDVEKKTAGIVPHEIDGKRFGAVTLYDFAGHKEFYASHDAIVRNTVTGPAAAIFLHVIDMRMSDKDFRKTALYWLQFIQDQCSSVRTKPHVILIGSHDDEVKSKEERSRKISIMESIQSMPEFSSLHFAGHITVNCCYGQSSSLSQLCHYLEESCSTLRDTVQSTFRSHSFFVYLIDKFQDARAILLSEVLHAVEKESEPAQKQLLDFVPCSTPEDLSQVCLEMNDRGRILFLKNAIHIGNSWIILDQGALLSIAGKVFAPEGFKEYHKLATSTGVVPFSKIGTILPDLNPDMIAKYLCHLEFCREITDPEVLLLLQRDYTATPTPNALATAKERFYFFPSLVSFTAPCEVGVSSKPDGPAITVPSAVWKSDERFSYRCGWMLQCSKPEQFLTPRFLQVLLLRLAFSFAFAPGVIDTSSHLPVLQRECTVWKNGMHWAKESGIKALVEVVDKSATVLLHCLKGLEVECTRFRSAIIQKILHAIKEFCPTVSTSEYFIHPDDATQYPLKPFPELTLVSCAKIAKAIAESEPAALDTKKNLVVLETLLHFEPYAVLDDAILQKMFDEHSTAYTQVAKSEHIEHFMCSLTQTIEPPKPSASKSLRATVLTLQSQRKVTYQVLREELDKFSVFSGRNPLEIAGVPVQPTEYTPPPEQGTVLCDPPTMMELIRFQGRERRINIPQEISTQCRQFGYLLLEDSTGARVQNIAETCRGNPEQMNMEILRLWINGEGKDPVTWTTLVEILTDSDLTTLAKDIQAVNVNTHIPV